jgi:protein neuralized
VKFSDISNNWSGVIRFGFTNNDPATLRNNLPKYACPDLTNKPGFWAKALNERYCYKNNVLFYYVTSTGDVHFGINGEEKGVFMTDVDTRTPLWCVIDVYGNSTSVEFLDSRIYMAQPPRNSRRFSDSTVTSSSGEHIIPAMDALTIQQQHQANDEQRNLIPAIRFTATNELTALPFHQTKGKHVRLSHERYVATRIPSEFCQGYVFTPRPVVLGEQMIVHILKINELYGGTLALGLTSCDPATLQLSDLPDDSDLLLDRPEYWIVSKDVASMVQRGDEIKFCVTVNGEVQISKNGGPASIVMHVDQSLRLWAFVDIYGSTQSARLFSCLSSVAPSTSRAAPPPYMQQRSLPISCESLIAQQQTIVPPVTNLAAAAANGANHHRIMTATSSDMFQIQPGGTVLVVNLPPQTHAGTADGLINQITTSRMSSASSTSLHSRDYANYSNTITQYKEVSFVKKKPMYCSAILIIFFFIFSSQPIGIVNKNPTPTASVYSSWRDTNTSQQQSSAVDCTICYENPIDSVLYVCGHMCMCFDCAIKQWRGIGGGHCPLCRAVIRDVIRTYKS